MRIVAVRTRHQSFVHAVVYRLREIRLDIAMAAVAQGRLRRHQQIMPDFCVVNGMTAGACDTIGQVSGPQEICVAFARLVAGQTALARLFGAESGQSNDFCGIASRIVMSFSWTMAGFASLPLRAAVFSGFGSPVRSAIITRRFRFMTIAARIRAGVERRVGRLQRRIVVMFSLIGKQRAGN